MGHLLRWSVVKGDHGELTPWLRDQGIPLVDSNKCPVYKQESKQENFPILTSKAAAEQGLFLILAKMENW